MISFMYSWFVEQGNKKFAFVLNYSEIEKTFIGMRFVHWPAADSCGASYRMQATMLHKELGDPDDNDIP